MPAPLLLNCVLRNCPFLVSHPVFVLGRKPYLIRNDPPHPVRWIRRIIYVEESRNGKLNLIAATRNERVSYRIAFHHVNSSATALAATRKRIESYRSGRCIDLEGKFLIFLPLLAVELPAWRIAGNFIFAFKRPPSVKFGYIISLRPFVAGTTLWFSVGWRFVSKPSSALSPGCRSLTLPRLLAWILRGIVRRRGQVLNPYLGRRGALAVVSGVSRSRLPRPDLPGIPVLKQAARPRLGNGPFKRQGLVRRTDEIDLPHVLVTRLSQAGIPDRKARMQAFLDYRPLSQG